MKKLIILFILTFLLISCTEQKENKTLEYKQVEQNISTNSQDKIFDTATISNDTNYEATENIPVTNSGSETGEQIFGSGEMK